MGIRVIIDGVFNHTGSDSVYFNKNGRYKTIGAYQSENSKYYSWYDFTNYPNDYSCWWGIKTLPQTREDSGFFDYMKTLEYKGDYMIEVYNDSYKNPKEIIESYKALSKICE